MALPSPNFRRHFLPWDRPLLPQAVTWLAGNWAGGAPLDLSATWVVVPTRQSGRRLREALAEHAAAKNQAVFAPRVHTPDTLLADGAKGADVATRLESLLAWAQVLRAIDFAETPDLFPVAPPATDFPWAWRLAGTFYRLQTQLTEGGLAFADVLRRVGAEFPERERWRQLAELESRQIAVLRGLGRREPHAARRDYAKQPTPPPGVTRIVVIAAPDPLPLALRVLAAWSETLPVEIVTFGPEDDRALFDSWGRPDAAAWAKRALALADFEKCVHLAADPAAEARQAAAMAARYGSEADGRVALGVPDANVQPLLENELRRVGLAGYNPEGRARRAEGLYALLDALAAFAREPSFDAMSALARCPDFIRALLAQMGPHGSAARWLSGLDALRVPVGPHRSAARWLSGLDALRARFLPPDLAAAERVARGAETEELRRGLQLMAELRRRLSVDGFPQNATDALELIFQARRFDLANDDDTRAAAAATAWRDVLRECASAERSFPELRGSEGWNVALALFGESRRAEDKPAGALDLQGWLELLWEDAPHLVVAGMNDGLVPDAIVGDAFLPETLREQLGLKTNAARFARDAYVLDAIAAARRAAGRLDLLLAKNSAAGDPLRPSRLLLRCADAELPGRVGFLFRAPAAAGSNLPWTRAWKLAPRRAPNPERVAVTGLRAWLACPFRFYLSHVLRMEPVDPAKSELDARDFGTICHAALEAMAGEAALRDCADENALREFLWAAFDRVARERFGEHLSLPLVVQLESARQRLAKAALAQARDRQAGWVVDRVEWEFALEISGLQVRGKIDRIDRHEASGAYRVLDYKTSDLAAPPHKTHLRPRRADDERLPAWRRTEIDGREVVWADLQLPVYLRAVGALAPGAAVSAGYFNLPKAVGETAIAIWSELTPDLLAAAERCAEGVAAAIRAGEFWPPNELPPDRDPFGALFHHGAADSVAWNSSAGILPAGARNGRLEAGATS